jgi:hypothetical protein
MSKGSEQSSDSWCTPKWLCDLLGEFDLDPCSNERSHLQAFMRLTGDSGAQGDGMCNVDGLAIAWETQSVYCNPPYSNVMPWAAKLAAHDGPWCALLKLDPTTKWWATLMSASPTFAPFRKRIKFEGDKAMTANFPSVLVFKRWYPSDELAKHLWLARYA